MYQREKMEEEVIFEPGFAVIRRLDTRETDELFRTQVLRLWRFTGPIDLIRRGVLGCSKLTSMGIMMIVNMESFSVIRVRQLTARPYFITMLACLFSGAFIESALSFFPKANRSVLSYYNGIYQVLENILLNLLTISIFYCGFREVPSVRNRYLPERECMKKNPGEILLTNLAVIPLNLLAGYMEFKKYKKTISSRRKSVKSIFYRVSFSSMNTLLAAVSLTLTISTIIEISEKTTISSVLHWSYLIPSLLLAIFSGLLEYHNCSNKKISVISKIIYFFSEIFRPCLGNYFASVYLIGTVVPLMFRFNLSKVSGVELRCLEISAYTFMCAFNIIRGWDSFWYKFKMPDQELFDNYASRNYGTFNVNSSNFTFRQASTFFSAQSREGNREDDRAPTGHHYDRMESLLEPDPLSTVY